MLELNKQQQLKLNYGTCIFDHFIIPENDDWIWELKKEKEEADRRYKIMIEALTKTK